MKANINDNPLKKVTIPKRYKRPNGITVDGYDQLIDLHYKDGWRDIVTPVYNPELERLGQLIIDGDEVTYKVITLPIPTPEEIAQKQLDAIKATYENHKQNGWSAYQDFRAKIVVDIANGVITEAQAFKIEAVLSVAYNRIANTGDWKTAHFELSQVTGFDAFIQPYYDEAMQNISEYITTNYN